jgi:hypothetical protein
MVRLEKGGELHTECFDVVDDLFEEDVGWVEASHVDLFEGGHCWVVGEGGLVVVGEESGQDDAW